MLDFGIDIPNELECLPSTMYVEEAEYGERTTSWGFEIPAETMDSEGNFVHPRWFKVLWKASNIKEINVGDWILQKHGFWTTSINITVNGQEKKVWYISPKSYKEGTLAISHTMPKIMKEFGYTN